jgi:omega-amidase
VSKCIRIGLYQQNIVWEDITANQKKIEYVIDSLTNKPDIFLLPEMYSTGFLEEISNLNHKQLAEQLNWQINISKQQKIGIIGSLIEVENDRFYNRLYYTKPDGSYNYYNKRHLFGIGGEDNYFIQGETREIFTFNSIRIMPQICYDLRFPVWSRNNLNYHLLIYSANWPASRNLVWETLLKARAIENQCYVVGVNRTGTDGKNISYIGQSAVFGPKGETLLFLDDSEQYAEVTLPIHELEDFRKSFPVLKDADDFELKTRNR